MPFLYHRGFPLASFEPAATAFQNETFVPMLVPRSSTPLNTGGMVRTSAA